MKRLLILMIFMFILLVGCQGNVTENGIVPESISSTIDGTEAEPMDSNLIADGSEKFKQILFDNKNEKYYVNWFQINEVYTINKDHQNAKMDYIVFNTRNTIAPTIDTIFSPSIDEDTRMSFIKNAGTTLEYIIVSPKGDKYLLAAEMPLNDIDWRYDYMIWLYDEEKGNQDLIKWKSGFQYSCPINSIDPSSVVWLAGGKYLYMKCLVEFGDLLIDIENGSYYQLLFDTRCPYAVKPVFSKNGEIAIANGAIYHTEDYMKYLEQCIRPDLDSMLSEDVSSTLLGELEKEKIIDTPPQLWMDYESYRISNNGTYYYFHEIGNGEYNDSNEGNINRINIDTGEIDTIITSDELKANDIDISGLIVYVAPDDNQLLLRNVIWENYIYIYNIYLKK